MGRPESRSANRAKVSTASWRAVVQTVISTDWARAPVQVRQYFSQGHDINFVQIESWIVSLLATLGASGRERFCQELADLVERHLSGTLKTSWNGQIAAITRAG